MRVEIGAAVGVGFSAGGGKECFLSQQADTRDPTVGFQHTLTGLGGRASAAAGVCMSQLMKSPSAGLCSKAVTSLQGKLIRQAAGD